MKRLQQIAVACLASLALGVPNVAAAGDDTFVARAGQGIVRVKQGDLMGFRDRGVLTFRGVPYAKAARFMPPQPADAWQGVRLAMSYGETCPVPEQTKVSRDEQFNAHRYFPQNEDCQFLNVWTPGRRQEAKRPVLVFLHGGGFTNGSSIEGDGYDGRNIAELGDIVVVTLNHRLNILGALDLSGFGPRYAQASNAGMRDVVAGLEWVRDNIEAFGGDPANVTIMGQSGGGGKVRFLMGIPSAKDLFTRAIVMSGTNSNAAHSKAVATAVARRTVAQLGLNARTIDRIQTVPYPTLLAAGERAIKDVERELKLSSGPGWRPSIDGTFAPDDPVQVGWAAYSANKPLLVGNVLEENNTIIRNDNGAFLADAWTRWSDAEGKRRLAQRYGAKAEEVAQAWTSAYPRDPLARAVFFSENNRASSLVAADFKTTSGPAPVYAYLYKWSPPVLDGVAGAWHVADVHMALYNADRLPQSFGGGEAARSMSFDVARAWINFVRSGDPNHAGLPVWPAYKADTRATMIFDDNNVVGLNHDRALLDVIARP